MSFQGDLTRLRYLGFRGQDDGDEDVDADDDGDDNGDDDDAQHIFFPPGNKVGQPLLS